VAALSGSAATAADAIRAAGGPAIERSSADRGPVGVDDQVNAFDVDTPGRDVRSHHDADGARGTTGAP
jgi:hypothetical protein